MGEHDAPTPAGRPLPQRLHGGNAGRRGLSHEGGAVGIPRRLARGDTLMLGPGAHPGEGGTRFVVHATRAREVGVRLFDSGGAVLGTFPLEPRGEARYEGFVFAARE